MKELLCVVDMVNGFVKEGAMHDATILAIVPSIIEKCQTHEHRLFIADTHENDAIEFKSFPQHCVKGTSESQIIDELRPYCTTILEKNSTNTFHVFDKAMIHDYDSFMIVGCCSDICVMQFAIALKTYCNQMNYNKKVKVPKECIATYNAAHHEASLYHQMALHLMEQAGIEI